MEKVIYDGTTELKTAMPVAEIYTHPYSVKNATAPEPVDEEFDAASPEDKARRLPKPMGYQILCMVPEAENKYENGLAKADVTMQHDEIMSLCLFVVDMGPNAYADATRFPHGAYCQKGDFILTKALSGTRFKIQGREFRLINDDSVLATVEDPRGISRV
jgi:co-chaperonin GroES (HSP10)